MTVRVVLACDGELHGEPCRQAIPVGAAPANTLTAELSPALAVAGAAGWTGDATRLRCPTCTRRELEHRDRVGRPMPPRVRFIEHTAADPLWAPR